MNIDFVTKMMANEIFAHMKDVKRLMILVFIHINQGGSFMCFMRKACQKCEKNNINDF